MATAVVTPRCFTRLRAGLVQVLIEFCSFVLWPFAVPGFRRASSLLWPLLTSPGLSARGSPWVSAAPVPSRRRALRAPFHDSWASRVLACSPTVARLTARSCSYGRRLASGPFARVPCGSHLAVRLRLSSSPRRGRFTPKGSAPARHTRPGARTGRPTPIPCVRSSENNVSNDSPAAADGVGRRSRMEDGSGGEGFEDLLAAEHDADFSPGTQASTQLTVPSGRQTRRKTLCRYIQKRMS